MEKNNPPSQPEGKQILEDLLAGTIRPRELRAESRNAMIEYMIGALPENPSRNVDVIRALKRVSGFIVDIVLKRIALSLVANRVKFDERAGLTTTLSRELMMELVQHQVARKEKSLADFYSELRALLPLRLHPEFEEEMAWLRLTESSVQQGVKRVA